MKMKFEWGFFLPAHKYVGDSTQPSQGFKLRKGTHYNVVFEKGSPEKVLRTDQLHLMIDY